MKKTILAIIGVIIIIIAIIIWQWQTQNKPAIQNQTTENKKTSQELMEELLKKDEPGINAEDYKIFEEIKSPFSEKTVVLFGRDFEKTQECCLKPIGLFIINNGVLAWEHNFIIGSVHALNNLYFDNVKWKDDNSILYDFTDDTGEQEKKITNLLIISEDIDINTPEDEKTKIAIMIPENIPEYESAMTEYSQTGEGSNPAETMAFIKKKFTIEKTTDFIKACAQAAAAEISPKGGPEKASVVYFKIKNKTAYVLLNIDMDGWAGVSVSIAIIHPLVEKTLLEFPIDKVVFDVAPGDSRENIKF
jgi:hypothetical protein